MTVWEDETEAPARHRVTFVVGAAVFLQSALGLLWAGAAIERINQLERRVDARDELMVRTTRLEEQVRAIRETVFRIEEKIDGTRHENP